MYGISDDNGNFEERSDESQQVVVPDTQIPLISGSFDSLVSSVDPLGQSGSYCADLYIHAINKVHSLMINDRLL